MRRHRLAALALLVGAAFLQACSTAQPSRDEGEASVSQAGAQAPARPTLEPSSYRPHGEGGFVPAAATMAVVPRRPSGGSGAGRSPRSARDLAGLTDGELLAVMGEPDLRREEEGTQAWLYRSPACLLDVFLEAEARGAEPRVVLATTRPAGAVRIAEEACLRGLARARAGLRQPFQP